jgi:hypothetical protein
MSFCQKSLTVFLALVASFSTALAGTFTDVDFDNPHTEAIQFLKDQGMAMRVQSFILDAPLRSQNSSLCHS